MYRLEGKSKIAVVIILITTVISCKNVKKEDMEEDTIRYELQDSIFYSPVDSIQWLNEVLKYHNIKDESVTLPPSFLNLKTFSYHREVYDIFKVFSELLINEKANRSNDAFSKLDDEKTINLLYDLIKMTYHDENKKDWSSIKEARKKEYDLYLIEELVYSYNFRTFLILSLQKDQLKPYVVNDLYMINVKDRQVRSIVKVAMYNAHGETYIQTTTRTNGKLFYTMALYGIIFNQVDDDKVVTPQNNTVLASLFQLDENGYVQLVEKKKE